MINKQTYISTLSTLTPHGSVASSSDDCMTWLMLSRSDKISAKFFVPKTFRRVVAAKSRVEWLKIEHQFGFSESKETYHFERYTFALAGLSNKVSDLSVNKVFGKPAKPFMQTLHSQERHSAAETLHLPQLNDGHRLRWDEKNSLISHSRVNTPNKKLIEAEWTMWGCTLAKK